MNPIPFPTRVLLFFARQPDEELSSADIAEKFGFESRRVASALIHRRRLGLLQSRVEGPPDRPEFIWSAGPVLRRECGLEAA